MCVVVRASGVYIFTVFVVVCSVTTVSVVWARWESGTTLVYAMTVLLGARGSCTALSVIWRATDACHALLSSPRVARNVWNNFKVRMSVAVRREVELRLGVRECECR